MRELKEAHGVKVVGYASPDSSYLSLQGLRIMGGGDSVSSTSRRASFNSGRAGTRKSNLGGARMGSGETLVHALL